MKELPVIDLELGKKEAPLGDLYGLFFEDLNHAADGGLYAEMVQNRSFEFSEIDKEGYHPLYAWFNEDGSPLKFIPLTIRVLMDTPIHPNNPHYLKINTKQSLAIVNKGFHNGMYFERNKKYRFSLFGKPDCGNPKISIELRDANHQTIGNEVITIDGDNWNRFETIITSRETVENGYLLIRFDENTDVAVDMLSLFPVETYKGRINGCRKDIAELLESMNPKFMRFPGGCLIHDGSLNSSDRDSMYRWKNTIGPVETRPTRGNSWGYNQTLGLGFFEYFQLCEDLKTEPIPVLPAGFDPHHQRAVPIEELGPWIQDALDLIEFANGDINSKWGTIRAEMGHPKPFHMKYIGIGNEEVGQAFFDRYVYFHKAIREKYPDIQIINSAGPFAAGSEYERGWQSARQNGSELVDEHYYQSPDWFLANHHRYDSYDSNGPKVFLGEYASKDNKWWNALTEASYMIGLERNADKVALACYAPMLANIDFVNWKPDMIWFNQSKVYGTPNYYVQKLFMKYQGTHTIPFQLNNLPEKQLKSKKSSGGDILIKGDGAIIEYDDFTIIDHSAGIEQHVKSGVIEDMSLAKVGISESDNYTIKFTFKKTGEKWDKGFKILFGYEDNDNYLTWALGGWQNQDCLIDCMREGASSVLTQSIWAVETGVAYHCELHVKNRFITTYINGQLFNEIEDKLTIIEPIYANAVYDQKTDEYYLKLVNVQDIPFTFRLATDRVEKLRAIEISGLPEMSNTIDNPSTLEQKEYDLSETKDDITVPAYGILFIRMNACKGT
ncbi:alpha-L-arabinofuranosidase C-terminal domain-containing protein [Niallia sp.]|uniref:alpha-L-arabinofuranosidase C-terminal domain-containing protein n=1 Tax=Niallia sp. TaxID=2837523 RepID=UPI00289F6559|nr:alpha-L-arabinofuranosidase C-terminal domain-containing protein [Niallia sp.]